MCLLEQMAEKEAEDNTTMVTTMAGQPVAYGSIVQLFHVKSHRFLQILPNTISETERTACAIEVRETGG